MKTREPEDKHCVLQCTYISYNIHDPIPLDNLKNHTGLPYITPARDMFQRKIDKIFKDSPNLFGILDDILVVG